MLMTTVGKEAIEPYEEIYYTVVGAHNLVRSIGVELKPEHTSGLTRGLDGACVYKRARDVYRTHLRKGPDGESGYTIAIDRSSITENDFYILPGKRRIVPVTTGGRELDRVQVDAFNPVRLLDSDDIGGPDFSGQLLPLKNNGNNPPSVLLEGREDWVPPDLLLVQQQCVAGWIGCLARQLGIEQAS